MSTTIVGFAEDGDLVGVVAELDKGANVDTKARVSVCYLLSN